MAQRIVSEPGIHLGTQQLTTLLNSTRELIAILSQAGTLQFVNSTFQSALGYRAEQLLGRSLFAIVHALDVEQLRERLKQVVAQEGSSITERCRVRAKDGTWLWLDVTCRDRLKEPGLEGVQLNALEVTHLNRMESERQVIADIVHALNETSDLDQLLTRIHAALKRVVSAENCFVALHEPEEDTFQFPFFADEYDAAPAPQRVGRSCTAYVFRTGRAKLIPQSEFDRLVDAGEVELVGSPSPAWLGVPLKPRRRRLESLSYSTTATKTPSTCEIWNSLTPWAGTSHWPSNGAAEKWNFAGVNRYSACCSNTIPCQPGCMRSTA